MWATTGGPKIHSRKPSHFVETLLGSEGKEREKKTRKRRERATASHFAEFEKRDVIK